MDPLSFSASLIAVLGLANGVLQVAKCTYKGVTGHMEQDLKALATNLTTFTGVLEDMKETGSQPTTRLISDALAECEKDLHKLLKFVLKQQQTASRFTKLKRKALWPYKEDEVKNWVDKIERYKTTFLMALGNETKNRTIEIGMDTRETHSDVKNLGRETAEIGQDTKDIKKNTEETNKGTKEMNLVLISLEEQNKLREQREAAEREKKLKEKQKRLAQSVYRWLSFAHPEENQINAQKNHTKGTGQWFLDRKEFCEWKASDSGFLWVNGIPGAGKTILSSTIIHHLIQEYNGSNTNFAYFYCDFRDATKHTARNVFSSITAQLLESIDTSIPDDIIRAYEKDLLTLDDAKRFMQMANKLSSKTVIVVDALDECSDRPELLSGLLELYKSSSGKLCMLLTSRYESDIKSALSERPSFAIESSHTEGDIATFVADEVEKHPRLKKLKPEIKRDVVATLSDGSRGVFFQWAKCSLDQISKQRTDKAIKSTLHGLPKDLFETYKRILDKIGEEDEELAQRIINWLVFSLRPLHLKEIVEAIAVEVGEKTIESDALLNDPDEILDICGSLVAIDEATGIVSLAHFSVREFFVSDFLQTSSISKFFVPSQRNSSLTRVCLTYLSFDDFREGPCDTREQLSSRLETHPFYEYAAQKWPTHATNPRESFGALLLADLQKFFDKDLSHEVFEAWRQAYYLSFDGKSIWESSVHDYLRADSTGHNQFVYACRLGLLPLVETLISSGADPNTQCYAEKDIKTHLNMESGTPLCAAVHSGNTDLVQFLLDNGAEANKIAAINNTTALSLAIDRGARDGQRMDIIELLVSRGADVHQVIRGGDYQGNVVNTCVQQYFAQALRFFLDRGVDFKLEDNLGMTPLITAVSFNIGDEMFMILHEYGATHHSGDFEFMFESFAIGLLFAVRNDLCRAACHVIETDGVRLIAEAPKATYHTIRDCAGRGYDEVLAALLEVAEEANWSGQVEAEQHDAFVRACLEASLYGRTRCVELLSKFMEKRGNAAQSSCLFPAIGRMNPDAVKKLLENGADPNYVDDHGWTPLLCAKSYAERGRESATALSKYGAKPTSAAVTPKYPSLWQTSPRWLEPYPEGLAMKDGEIRLPKDASSFGLWTDHPIPPLNGFYYFEMHIVSLPDNNRHFGIGVMDAQYVHCEETQSLYFFPYGKMCLCYHPDGNLETFRAEHDNFGPSYAEGDVVGCAVDLQRQMAVFLHNGEIISTGACGAVRGMVFPMIRVGPGASARMILGKELEPHMVEKLSQVEIKYDFYSNIDYVEPPDDGELGRLQRGPPLKGTGCIR